LSPPNPSRLALVVSADPWLPQALETVLRPAGYMVLHATNGAEAIEQAARVSPDIVWVWNRLPDMSAAAVCRRVREDQQRASIVPILVLGPAPFVRAERLDVLRAGAWDVLAFPFDTEEQLLKIDAYVRSKRAAEHAREDGLIDPTSGLYSQQGIERRVAELVADSARRRVPLAVVVITADSVTNGSEEERRGVSSPAVVHHVAALLQARGRLSDAIGRWREGEFAIVAPATDSEGAAKLAGRLAEVVESTPLEPAVPAGSAQQGLRVRAGYEVLDDFAIKLFSAQDLLAHASAALRMARQEGGRGRFVRYRQESRV
jgi:diguanylate cyclase (GGDEF)-like protein